MSGIHATMAEQKRALEAERQKAEKLSRDFAATRAELEQLKSRPTLTTDSGQVLADAKRAADTKAGAQAEATLERQKAEKAVADLVAAHTEIEQLKGRLASEEAQRAAEVRRATQQEEALAAERQKAEKSLADAVSARAEIEQLKARIAAASEEPKRVAETMTARQAEALRAERQKAERSAAEVALALAEIEQLKGQLTAAKLAYADAVEVKRTAEAVTTHQAETLRAERQRAERFAAEGASAVAEIEQLKGQLTAAKLAYVDTGEAKRVAEAATARQAEALRAERQRAAKAEADVASVRAEVEQLKRRLAEAGRSEAGIVEAKRAAEAAAARQVTALTAERQTSERLSTEIASVRAETEQLKGQLATVRLAYANALEGKRAAEAATSRQLEAEAQNRSQTSAEAVAHSASVSENGRSPEEAAVLTRAGALIRQGDVKGARLLLEHILEGASAEVAFVLAETYDPNMLSAWRTLGIRGDAKKAQELYLRAHNGGIAKARGQAAALK